MDYSSGESTRVLSVDTPHIPRSDIIDFGKFPELLNIRDGTLPEIVCLVAAREWEVDPEKDLEKSLLDPVYLDPTYLDPTYPDELSETLGCPRTLDDSEFKILVRLSREGFERGFTELLPWRIDPKEGRAIFWYTTRMSTIQLVFQGGWEIVKIVQEKGHKKEEKSLKEYEELRNIALNYYEAGSRIYVPNIIRTDGKRNRIVRLPPISKFEEHFYRPLPLDMALRFFYRRKV